jgi:hypothetical protein
MATVDPRSQLQQAMETADARFQHQADTLLPGPHLTGTTEVRGVERRTAEVREPADRLLLAAEDRSDPRDPHYTQLQQSADTETPPIITGRAQDPTTRNAAPTERHIFEQGTRGAPSYPREASNLSSLAEENPRQPYALLENTMLVQPIASEVPDEATQRHLMTTADIIGISEQRRDPYMSLASAQTITNAARSEEPPPLSEVFGERRGRENLPGLLPASGTGATADFRELRADLEADQPPSTSSSQRLFDNISEQHLDLMRQSIEPENLQRMAAEGYTDIPAMARVRAESAATRLAARETGQLPYDLRTLLPAQSSSTEEEREKDRKGKS